MSSPALWYATRATGLVALVLLTLSTVLGVLTANRTTGRSWPGFAQQDLHKRVALMSVTFLALHVLTSVVDTYVHIGLLSLVVPFASGYDKFWVALGTLAVDLLLAVVVTSLFRRFIKARLWRALHWLAYLSWPVALAHAFGMGTDMDSRWGIALGVGCATVVASAVTSRLYLHARHRTRAQRRSFAPEVLSHLRASPLFAGARTDEPTTGRGDR
jgi:sulfoxide reductase heme-binding subunit YedZ